MQNYPHDYTPLDDVVLRRVVSYITKRDYQITQKELESYKNYEDVKSWFNVQSFDNKLFYVALYEKKIVGYYFKCIEKGNRVEIIPDFRKNSRYGYLEVYKKLHDKIAYNFPFGLYSTVSLLNIPSLSTHLKNGFKICDITYPITYDLTVKFFYEFNDASYEYNNYEYFPIITDLIISNSRNLKCYMIKDGNKIYLEKVNNCFVVPKELDFLAHIKYKFVFYNENCMLSKDIRKPFKEALKKHDVKDIDIDEIGKLYQYEFLGWLIENGYLNIDKISNEFNIKQNDKNRAPNTIWEKYIRVRYKHILTPFMSELKTNKSILYTLCNKFINILIPREEEPIKEVKKEEVKKEDKKIYDPYKTKISDFKTPPIKSIIDNDKNTINFIDCTENETKLVSTKTIDCKEKIDCKEIKDSVSNNFLDCTKILHKEKVY